MVPRVLFPTGISTPDYLIDGEKWDLKTLESNGRNVFYNLTKGKKKQANNFVFDLSNIEIDDDWIDKQVRSLYCSKNRDWIKDVIVLFRNKVLKVYKRK